ncbi:ATPase [Alkaliphilus sp. MSJ-5]|uniref:ATPase n=1 Tax=Alkaliphilus flagellatus TaxID=2841507 RepID=A0ABS6G0I0_9FIRM|nr:ATPase [Alkaliphilus flagellatus]MBU5675641.1 ATPase [Alkaliphilus flagellatus]
MGNKGHIKRLLPGGNTSVGFYSYFKYIINPSEARKIYYFKGGPGVGKSYMMKKIGYELVDRGIDVEFHHCSAEPESIDVIVIPSIKVVLLDATSPHMDDPRYPGVTGTIVNLGEFINEEAMRKHRDSVIEATDDNKNIYVRVYKYLAAAKLIHDDIEWITSYAMDFNKVNKETIRLIKKYLVDIEDKNRIGKERHLFGSAYTLKGKLDFAETFIGIVEGIVYIKGADGTGKSTLLEKLSTTAVMKGYDVEIYHEPLVPQKIESIIIPELDLAFTTNSKFKDNETVDLDEYINEEKIEKYGEELEYSNKVFNQLLNDVFANLGKTNGVHDKMEKYYVPNVFHEGLNEVREKILGEIIDIIEER